MLINEEVRAQLLEEVATMSDADLNQKPTADKWSVRQVLEHLYLMEGGVAKIIKRQLSSGEIHTTSDKPIEKAVDRSIKVDVPDFAKPSEEYKSYAELLDNLSVTHMSLKTIEESATEEQLAEKTYLHPVFGEMSLKQWIPFVAYHELRHLEQIKEVKEALTPS
jgi:uncharacterized damage-inducible protein DinB